MEPGKIFLGKVAPIHDCNGQGIAQRQHHRRTRRRGQIIRASLRQDMGTQGDVCQSARTTIGSPCDYDRLGSDSANGREQFDEFVSFATMRVENHHISSRDHSQIAMNRF